MGNGRSHKGQGNAPTLTERVKDIDTSSISSLEDLLESFGRMGGFTTVYLSRAIDILRMAVSDKECTRWFSFVGALVATGVRGVIGEAINKGLFHYVVTTCGALDHDIARSYGEYYSGDFKTDDVALLRSDVHRVGSVLVPRKTYGERIEKFMQDLLEEVYKEGIREVGTYELCRLIGERIEDEYSILRRSYKSDVLVFVPGIMDGAVGTQLWLFNQRHRDFRVNLFKDFDKLAEITFKMRRSAGLIAGGGISKHFLIWWAQFGGGLDYAVQITTAVEYDGSLSGASLSEAISWRKVKPTANHVTIYGDATLLLPLLLIPLIKNPPS